MSESERKALEALRDQILELYGKAQSVFLRCDVAAFNNQLKSAQTTAKRLSSVFEIEGDLKMLNEIIPETFKYFQSLRINTSPALTRRIERY